MAIPRSEFIPSQLELSATLDVQAADSDASPSKLFLLANTGTPMDLPGFADPVIVDMAGVKFDKNRTPIIIDHDTSRRVGYTQAHAVVPFGGNVEVAGRKVKGPAIAAAGIASSVSGEASELIADARGGFPFQVSIGASIVKGFFVDDGDTVEVNGKTHKGPLIVAQKTLIRELSVTVLGADNKTAAKVTAINAQSKRSVIVEKELRAYIESLGLKPDDLDKEQIGRLEASFKKDQAYDKMKADLDAKAAEPITAAAKPPAASGIDVDAGVAKRREAEATETERVDTIRATAKKYTDEDVNVVTYEGKEVPVIGRGSLQARAIRDNWRPNDFELLLLQASRPKAPAIHSRGDGGLTGDIQARAIEVAMLRAGGKVQAKQTSPGGVECGFESDRQYTEQVLEASDRVSENIGPHWLMDRTIRASGERFSGSQNSEAFLKAFFRADRQLRAASGMGTHDLSNILENVANKTMMAAYTMQTTVWRNLCRIRTANDFKAQSSYRLQVSAGFSEIGHDGALPHAHMVDSKNTLQVKTRGQQLVIGRTELRNDDMNALNDAPAMLGANGVLAIEDTVLSHLLTNRASFTTLTGANLDLDIAGLSAAEQSFRNQVDAASRPILVPPDRMLVGTQDAVQAGQLFNDAYLNATGTAASPQQSSNQNPHVRKFSPHVSPYLNNTNIRNQAGGSLTNQDANQWYLACNPEFLAGIEIAFLDGKQEPYLFTDEMPFEYVGGIRFKSYFDFGVATGDTMGILFSPGA